MKRINFITTIDKEEEEKECNHVANDLQDSTEKETVTDRIRDYLKEFMSLEDDVVISAERFRMLHKY